MEKHAERDAAELTRHAQFETMETHLRQATGETTPLLKLAMATLLQNQVLFEARMDRRDEKLDKKSDAIDRRFERIEALLSKILTEMPERVFGFAQAAAKQQSQ